MRSTAYTKRLRQGIGLSRTQACRVESLALPQGRTFPGKIYLPPHVEVKTPRSGDQLAIDIAEQHRTYRMGGRLTSC